MEESEEPKISDTFSQNEQSLVIEYTDIQRESSVVPLSPEDRNETTEYVMYRIRWLGMFAIIALNLSTGLVWLTFNAVSDLSSDWLHTGKSQVNLTVILYFVGYVLMSPFSGYAFEKWGIKKALLIGAMLNFLGTWIRYFGHFVDSSSDSYEGRLAVILAGQLIAAMGQPFFLNVPPKYAAVWFSESSRTTATTIGSVSNPIGAAVAMVVVPELCKGVDDMPMTLLIIAIVATVAIIPTTFMQSVPPTPPSGSAALALEEAGDEPFWISIRKTWTNVQFWLLFSAFSVFVAFFNAFSSLLNQIVTPYGYTDDDAGYFGASLILFGIIGAGLSGAFVDKTKKYRLVLRLCTPILGIAYVAMIFAVRENDFAGIMVVCGAVGLSSFALLPVALELGIECTYPTPPSTSTSLLWMGGQTFAVIFLIVGDNLRDESPDAEHPENMRVFLICMAAVASLVGALSFLYNSPNYRLEAERQKRIQNVLTNSN